MARRSTSAFAALTVVLASSCAAAATNAELCADPPPYESYRMSLTAVDARTGDVRWRHDDLPLYANLYTHLDGGDVIVSNGSSGQRFDVATGAEGARPPGTVPAPLTAGAVRSTDPVPPGLTLENALDGPVVAGAVDVVISGAAGEAHGELVGYDPADGTRRWSVPLDRPTHSPPLVSGDVVLITTGDSTPNCG
jgi:outer membrane protein assembly factor BamB